MQEKKKTAAALLLGLTIGITGMWIIYSGIFDTCRVPSENYTEISKAGMLSEYIQNTYYKDVDSDALSDGMCKGMTESLGDPYSVYMTAEEYKTWEQDINGEFYGVGLTMQEEKQKGRFVVRGVIKGSPAEDAGFEEGDVVTEVDGKRFESLSDAVKVIRGEKDTKVTLTYVRNGNVYKETLVRAEIKTESVEGKMLDNKVGYVAISAFTDNTGKDFTDAVEKLEKEGAKSLVVDLRNNGGGLLNEGIAVADELLGEGIVVEYIDNKGNKTYSHSDKNRTKLPYAVLVNGASASASEIVTAAIKDNKGGKIVGTKTFGKGIIQSTKRLPDGSAIKLTVMEYRSPAGHKIHEKGIEPDCAVKLKKGDKTDYQLNKAIELIAN